MLTIYFIKRPESKDIAFIEPVVFFIIVLSLYYSPAFNVVKPVYDPRNVLLARLDDMAIEETMSGYPYHHSAMMLAPSG